MTHVSGRPRFALSVHFFVPCQTDKQHFSPFSWNNLLSKIKSHSLIPLLWDISLSDISLWDISLDISPVDGLRTFRLSDRPHHSTLLISKSFIYHLSGFVRRFRAVIFAQNSSWNYSSEN